MKTETINLYKFEELSQEAQDKAIMKVANDPHYLDYNWWDDYMHDDFHERLKEIGIECKDFYWDMDRGRYFRMEGARIADERLFLKSAGFIKQLILLELEEELDFFSICIDITEQRESTNRIEVDYNYDKEGDVEKFKEIFGEDMDEKLTGYLQNILEGFLKEISDEYEYMNSAEYIKEDLINRDDDYTMDGEKW